MFNLHSSIKVEWLCVFMMLMRHDYGVSCLVRGEFALCIFSKIKYFGLVF